MKKRLILTSMVEIIAIIIIVSMFVVSAAPTDSGNNLIEETAVKIEEESVVNPKNASTEEIEEGGADLVSQLSRNAYGVLDTAEAFSNRDLLQTPSLKDVKTYTVTDNSDIHITTEGIYVLSGTAQNSTIYVEADNEAKVQLVLEGVSLTNQDFPSIYVVSADKVFITTIKDSYLAVTDYFRNDGETKTDGVIFSRSDLVLNGTASLSMDSIYNGVVCKDDLKITGGKYIIHAASKAMEANDSIRIAGGSLELEAGTDALHAENEDDDSLGYVYICGGDLVINAGDDGIHGTSVVQIDGGNISITAAEGIEGTYIQLNDGIIDIYGWDDGINGANKSTSYVTCIEINGGEINVAVGEGDTDGIDSNGNLTINGGTVSVTGNSTFDCDGTVEYNGGIVFVNGEQVSEIPNQMGMRGKGGGHGKMW